MAIKRGTVEFDTPAGEQIRVPERSEKAGCVDEGTPFEAMKLIH